MLFAITLALIGFSCVSQRKYVAEVVERKKCLQQEKNLQQQLESYSTRLAYKDGQLQSLNAEVSRLDKHNQELQSQLDQLINDATSQQEEMEKAIQEKSRDLNQKEILINRINGAIEKRNQLFSDIKRRMELTLRQYEKNTLNYVLTDCCLHIKIDERLLFEAGGYEINQKGIETLGRLAAALRESPDLQIQIIGRTDSLTAPPGALRLNWDFMALRAASAGRVLTEDYGLRPQQITVGARNIFSPESGSQNTEQTLPAGGIDIILHLSQDQLFSIIRNKDSGN